MSSIFLCAATFGQTLIKQRLTSVYFWKGVSFSATECTNVVHRFGDIGMAGGVKLKNRCGGALRRVEMLCQAVNPND
jgi:hypothetical protein